MQNLGHILSLINRNYVWGIPMLVLLIGTGILLTVRFRGIQFTRFGYILKITLLQPLRRRNRADDTRNKIKQGSVTPFQAMCTALAATVGTGNIAGVGGAVALGGPGAVFWMWVSAFFGMATKFAEITLAVRYRVRNREGDWVGGPMYYIQKGLGSKWKWLAAAFCVFGALSSFGIGNMTQINTIVSAVSSVCRTFGWTHPVGNRILAATIGIAAAVLVMIVFAGGIRRVGTVTERLVPFMSLLYISMTLIVIAVNYRVIGTVFSNILRCAFTPKAVLGGGAGIGISEAIKFGIGRGIFSNEAGLGSAPIAHAATETDSPVRQGFYGIFEVFVVTIVICTLTALTILCAEANPANLYSVDYGTFGDGAVLTVGAISTVLEPKFAGIVFAIGMTLFALSTIFSWSLYGVRCVEFLFGKKAVVPYRVVFLILLVIGALSKVQIVWELADLFNALMAVPNLIALIALSSMVGKLVRFYFHEKTDAELAE